MALSQSQIISYISKAQRAQEAGMLAIVEGKRTGRKGDSLYFPMLFLSAGVDVLTSNHGLSNLQIEIIIQEMIEQGNLNDFSGDPIPYLTNYIILPSSLGIKITDLIDGPHTGGPLTSWPNYFLQVMPDGSAWHFVPAVSGSITVANTIFVAKNGNDSTGLIERLDKPFLTVTAAQAAASSGMLICVFPGTYTDGNLSKDGLNYYFSDGYIYNGSADWFGDAVTTTPVTCKISGYARGTNGRMIFSQNVGAVGSVYDFAIRSWISSATSVIACFNGSTITVNALEDLQGSTRVVRYRANLLADGVVAKLKVTCRTMYASGTVLIEPFANKIAAVEINANLVIDPSYGGSGSLGAINILQAGIANIIHRGSITVLPGISTQDPVIGSNINPLSTITSYSDIFSTGLQPMFGFGNSGVINAVSQYGVRHFGKVTHSGQLIFFSSGSICNIELNGDYISNLDSSMNFPMIEADLTEPSVIQLNGKFTNGHNNTNSHVVKKAGAAGGDWNCKILQTTRLIATNLSCYCMTGDTYYTYKVYNGSASNVIADPLASLQIISNILVDTNVD